MTNRCTFELFDFLRYELVAVERILADDEVDESERGNRASLAKICHCSKRGGAHKERCDGNSEGENGEEPQGMSGTRSAHGTLLSLGLNLAGEREE
jgi:hypothetical protein